MITLSKLASSVIEQGKRILKVKQFGVKTAKESYPFGFDSSAPEGYTAIFADTSNKDESVVLGYIGKQQEASIGESRMYAVDSSGEVVGYFWAKSSGILELNGDQFTAVRFEPLKSGINAKDQQIQQELANIAAAINAIAPGSYTPGIISTNLEPAKSESVKIK